MINNNSNADIHSSTAEAIYSVDKSTVPANSMSNSDKLTPGIHRPCVPLYVGVMNHFDTDMRHFRMSGFANSHSLLNRGLVEHTMGFTIFHSYYAINTNNS